MEIFSIIIIAFSLSMDAFSLALAYGTLSLSKSFSWKLSISVGIFHFLMPLLGMCVKYCLIEYSDISFEFITCIIYFYLGISFLLELKEKRVVSKICTLKDMILFSVAVSLDSFSVGIAQDSFIVLAPIIYSFFSTFFTMLGLKLGKKLNYLLGKTSILVGGIFFLLLGLLHL